MLTSMQRDALTEILNIHLCASAGFLSEMVNQRIILSVPELKVQNDMALDPFLLDKLGVRGDEDVTLTSLTFSGEFCGQASIVFPKRNADVLVSACLGREPDEEIGLLDIDIDVIKEISNIILNSLVGEFGNILDVKLNYVSLETGFSLSKLKNGNEKRPVFVLFTSFFMTDSQIRGIILISLASKSYEMLINRIDAMIRENNV